MFKVKSSVSGIGDSATDTAKKAQRAGEDAIDAASSWTNRLTEQQRKIGTIVLGIVAFNVVISAIASAFR